MTLDVVATLAGAHAPVLPIVWPLAIGALLLLLETVASRWVAPVSIAATLALALLAAGLFARASGGSVDVVHVGAWPAPWGIALALDRLAALMLLLTAVVGVAAAWHAIGGDDRHGAHFHSLLQFQLMGLNGAFLTADLFNLFVFFEVLLAASYGLLLHGRSAERLRAGVHYVVFNLAGSAVFLIALGLIFGATGTLNMADLARKLPLLDAGQAMLVHAGAALLLVVFAVKAALLPLYFWLPETYAAAAAPVATLFAVLTKVGVYAIVRTSTLLFGAGGALPGLADTPALPVLALATLVLASLGALAATRLRLLVAYLVLASGATLLLAVGIGTPAALAAALFYLVHSTFTAAAWFALADRIGAARGGSDELSALPIAAWPALGVSFVVAAVASAGLPPAAGFLGKALLLQAAGDTRYATWAVALVLGSGLAMVVALARAGARLFWMRGPADAAEPASDAAATFGAPRAASISTWRGAAFRDGATAALVVGVGALPLLAGPLAAYAEATVAQLHHPQPYVDAVLSTVATR